MWISLCQYRSIRFSGKHFPLSVVLDGHDGLHSVQWLSEYLFPIFSDVLDETMYDGSCSLELVDQNSGLCCPMELSPPLTKSFHAADRQLLERLKSVFHFKFMEMEPSLGIGGVRAMKSGSTATVALVRPNKIIVANVGDSRCVLCRKGRAIDLTTEHRVYGKVTFTLKDFVSKILGTIGFF